MFPAKLAKATAVSGTAVAIIAIAPVAAYGQPKPQNVTVVNPTTSPVNALITNADPIPVTVNQPAEEVVQLFTVGTIHRSAAECSMGAVPAGKRLVVDYVSGRVAGSQGDVDPINEAGMYIDTTFPLHLIIHRNSLSPGFLTISQPVTLYAEAGQFLKMFVANGFGADLGEQVYFECSVVGRLVNAP